MLGPAKPPIQGYYEFILFLLGKNILREPHRGNTNRTVLVLLLAGCLQGLSCDPAECAMGWERGLQSCAAEYGVWGPWGLAGPEGSSKVAERAGQPCSKAAEVPFPRSLVGPLSTHPASGAPRLWLLAIGKHDDSWDASLQQMSRVGESWSVIQMKNLSGEVFGGDRVHPPHTCSTGVSGDSPLPCHLLHAQSLPPSGSWPWAEVRVVLGSFCALISPSVHVLPAPLLT